MLRPAQMLTVAAAAALFAGVASARASEPRPALVEMFLSQSCKASPPAADLARELAARPDLVVLTWHVSYWNAMTGAAGQAWDDPFSKEAFDARQRRYNQRIRQRDRGYSPQAVINGEAIAVGFRRADIDRLIASRTAPGQAAISFDAAGRRAVITADSPGEAFVVTFLKRAETPVAGGDNAGRVFAEAHIATAIEPLGAVAGGTTTFALPPLGPDEGCAVIVQEPDQGPALGAAYCPPAPHHGEPG